MKLRSPEERVGTVVCGRYRVERVLGKGGMGVVLAGTHTLTGRRVAIKVLLPELARDADVLARFFQEAKTAAALDHPNVVDTLDMGVEDEEPYIVLELLDGASLGQLADAGPMPPAQLLPIVLPVIDALAAAHEHGIVHRDLKPENIFVATDARGRPVPKVLDFGIAKLIEGETSVATRTGGILGTPQYMSPEQAMGEKDVGPASDVWSMGVVLYECFSGRPAFAAPTVAALMMQICSVDPAPLTHWVPDLDPRIAAVVHAALEREPEARLGSMQQLGAALVVAATASGVELPPGVAHLFEDEQPAMARFAEPRRPPPPPVATGPIPPYDHPGLPVDEPVDPLARTESAPPPAPSRRVAPLALVGVALIAVVGALGWWALASAPGDEPNAVADPGVSPPSGPRETDPATSADGGPTNAESAAASSLPTGIDPPVVESPTGDVVERLTRRLESRPSDAEVWVGGARIGRTPMDVPLGEGGATEVELRLRGHSSRTVILTEGEGTESVTLRPRTPRVAGGSDLAPR